MRVKVNSKIWDLEIVPQSKMGKWRGHCDSPETPNKKIKISSALKDEEFLEVLIHEILHAGMWQIDEEEVATISEDLARIIYKLEYKINLNNKDE